MNKKLILLMAIIFAFSQTAAVVVAAEKALEFKSLPQVTKATPQVSVIPDDYTSKQSSAGIKAPEKTVLESQIKTLQTENQKLKEDAAKKDGAVKSIQAALANTDSKVKQVEEERQRLSLEVQKIKSQLSATNAELQVLRTGGKSNLVTLADSGEAVYFKGIGEARMAAVDGKSVIRFPLSASNKADKVLLGTKAEKFMNGAFVYYIMDSAGLVF